MRIAVAHYIQFLALWLRWRVPAWWGHVAHLAKRVAERVATRWRRRSGPSAPSVDEGQSYGAAVAERVANYVGSWRFIGLQAALMGAWVTWNALAATRGMHWDEYPYVFLNLAMSAEAAFTGPVLLIAANVSAIRDRRLAEQVRRLVEANATLTQQNAAIVQHVETLVEQMAKLVAVDHDQHGRLLRDLHAHTVCSGHTIIASTGDHLAATV